MHKVLAGLLVLSVSLPRLASGQPANPASEGWQRVDALKAETRIVVTLETGQQDTYYFRRSTADDVTVATGPEANARADVRTLPKSLIKTITTYDPLTDGASAGAVAGAGGVLAWLLMGVAACGIGCDGDLRVVVGLPVAVVGAATGGVIGMLADADAGGPQLLYPSSVVTTRPPARPNRFYPSQAAVRVGTTYTQLSFSSRALEGAAAAPTFSFGVKLSPHISTHVEYTRANRRFNAPTGAIPDTVLDNLVPSCRCAAGVSHGIASRDVRYSLTQLVGVHPDPWGRLRVEFVGGLGILAQEARDYYDAYGLSEPGAQRQRLVRIPGKYYVLNFQSPRAGAVIGVNAEIAVTRHISAVPMVRYNWYGDPGPSLVYGVGAHVRF
ncbi:MAG: hypothetical protein Q7R30_08060 [Acidobacteriota bacterium]|nr:hypothetical protein [Acidobacteriota bacterium]